METQSTTQKNEDGTTKTPLGLAENIKNGINGEDVMTCLKGDLLEGEIVVAVYDVHIPGLLMPRWLWWLSCIITCGLFACCYYLQRWCVAKGCCAPQLIVMARGKMALTNYNRLLVWKTGVVQQAAGSCEWPRAPTTNLASTRASDDQISVSSRSPSSSLPRAPSPRARPPPALDQMLRVICAAPRLARPP